MKTLIVVDNPLDQNSAVKHSCASFVDKIRELYPEFTPSMRVYSGEASSQEDDITPTDASGVDLLETQDVVTLVVYPEDSLIISAIIKIAISVALNLLFAPKPDSQEQRNIRATSPNNELSERTNQARIKGRIPDIYGEVISTPDLIAVSYKVFENSKEVEISYMCIGRGEYEVSDFKDGETPIVQISGASVSVYGPNTSPNFGEPVFQIGDEIEDRVLSIAETNLVNGQTLEPSNVDGIDDGSTIRFVYPNIIETNGAEIVFSDYYGIGSQIVITDSDRVITRSILGVAESITVNFDGTYEVTGVSSTELVVQGVFAGLLVGEATGFSDPPPPPAPPNSGGSGGDGGDH